MERVLAAVEAEAAKVVEDPVGVDSVDKAPVREVAEGAKVPAVVAQAGGSVVVAVVITVLGWAKAVVEAETTAQVATMELAAVVAETTDQAAVVDLVDLAVAEEVD